jgi:hypothetical protein
MLTGSDKRFVVKNVYRPGQAVKESRRVRLADVHTVDT